MADEDFLNAAAAGDIRLIRKLVFANPSIAKTCVDGNGKSALHRAARHGQADVVALLLHHGADVNVLSMRKHRSPLYEACSKGYLLVVSLLISAGADINSNENRGRTPLYVASLNNHSEVVSELLDKGADYHLRDDNGKNAICAAAVTGSTSVLHVLLHHPRVKGEENVLVNTKDIFGRMPMHYACIDGAVASVALLLNHGADGYLEEEAFTPNEGFNTALLPLHSACYSGHEDVVALLLDQARVNINMRDRNQCTPLHMASRSGKREVGSMLLARGCDSSVLNNKGRPALLEACIGGSTELVYDLLNEISVPTIVSSGCTSPPVCRKLGTSDVNIRDCEGRSALHMASYNGHRDIVELLLQRRCIPSGQDSDGQTALHMAALGGKMDIIPLLLSWGLDATLRDCNGNTARDVAKTNELKDLIAKVGVNEK